MFSRVIECLRRWQIGAMQLRDRVFTLALWLVTKARDIAGSIAIQGVFMVWSVAISFWNLVCWLQSPFFTVVIGVMVVRMVRYNLDTFWRWIDLNVWLPHNFLAQDDHGSMDGVKSLEELRYGDHERETVHVITPETVDPKQTTKHLLYVHGGGFVAANSAVLLHSVTTFCRNGVTVYGICYPLAPDDRFPRAIVSVLKALAWVKSTYNIEHLSVMGDSAGGSIMSYATALLLNPMLMQEFEAAAKEPVSTWSYPCIDSQICMYGVLDQKSWQQRLESISTTEDYLAKWGLGLCLSLYRSEDNTFENRFTLCDVIDKVFRYPKTLLIGASKDPLLFSALTAHDALKHLDVDVQLHVFDARHGFFGFPPAFNSSWRTSALPCCTLVNHFLNPNLAPAPTINSSSSSSRLSAQMAD